MTQNQQKQNVCDIAQVFICEMKGYADWQLWQKSANSNLYAEKLLKFAHHQLFGDGLPCNYKKLPSGKPVCDGIFVSFSHSGKYVCVALCDKPVGVDLQKFSGAKIDSVAKKFFTQKELAQFATAIDKTDAFYFTWCKKEALWKMLDTQPATVAPVDTTNQPFTTQKLTLDGETFYLAVTGEAEIRFVEI